MPKKHLSPNERAEIARIRAEAMTPAPAPAPAPKPPPPEREPARDGEPVRAFCLTIPSNGGALNWRDVLHAQGKFCTGPDGSYGSDGYIRGQRPPRGGIGL